MLPSNGFKRFVADSAARAGIHWTPCTQGDGAMSVLNICHFHILPGLDAQLSSVTDLAAIEFGRNIPSAYRQSMVTARELQGPLEGRNAIRTALQSPAPPDSTRHVEA
jgi:hypothetical protein